METTFYLVLISNNQILSESPTKTIPLDGLSYLVEGDINLLFPIVEDRISELGTPYKWVVENVAQLDSYNSLLSEQEILKFEIMSEDYSTGTIPQLRKLARLRQLELILASGSF